MFRVLLLASLVACGLGAVTPRLPRPRLDGRIVGGEPVNIEDYPYQVALEILDKLRCGGSIISTTWVVTAAHCVDGITLSSVKFRAGSSSIQTGGTLHVASQINVHPLFDAFTIDFDVAVAKVTVAFTYGPGVQAIGISATEAAAGAPSTVSGWGTLTPGGSLPSQLQAVEVNITSRAECNSAYVAYGGITANMICAGVTGGGKDACQGDSGGPLVVGGQLVGIVSWGLGCAFADYPGVYSNVATLKSFITDLTGIS